jgi:phosphatidylinositol glycan class M
MSTRGSNDNIIAMLVYVTMYYLLKKEYIKAGFIYGLSVHFKIYPIIYSFVFYLYIDCDKKSIRNGKGSIFKDFFTKNRLIFTLVSAGTFIGFTALFYAIYGYEFLYEGYLYHFVRKDNRHNYSVYFYTIY